MPSTQHIRDCFRHAYNVLHNESMITWKMNSALNDRRLRNAFGIGPSAPECFADYVLPQLIPLEKAPSRTKTCHYCQVLNAEIRQNAQLHLQEPGHYIFECPRLKERDQREKRRQERAAAVTAER